MATWNSTPSVPHTGGTFNFPQNTTDNDIVYTIEYTDDNGCTTSTTYLVPSCGCSVYGFVDRGISVDSRGGTPIVAESLSSADTLTFSSSSPISAEWITFNSVETSGKKMYRCNVTENTSQDSRIGLAVFTSNDGCEFTATVTQSGKTEQTYEIRYTLTSTSKRLSAQIKYINGSPSIFTQSELSTVIQIEPSYKSLKPSMCEVLDAEAMTLDRLLGLKVGDKLYEDENVYGKNLCIASGISITIPDDPTGIWKRIVLKKIG